MNIVKGLKVAYDPEVIDLNAKMAGLYKQRDQKEDKQKVQKAILDLVSTAASITKDPKDMNGDAYELMTAEEFNKMDAAINKADKEPTGKYTLAELEQARVNLSNSTKKVENQGNTSAVKTIAVITDAANGISGGYWYGFNGADNAAQINYGEKAIVKSFQGSDPGFGVSLGQNVEGGATHLQIILSGVNVKPGYNKVLLQVYSEDSEERSKRQEFGIYPGGEKESGDWAPNTCATKDEADSFYAGKKTSILIPLNGMKQISKLQILIPGRSSGTIKIYSVIQVKK